MKKIALLFVALLACNAVSMIAADDVVVTAQKQGCTGFYDAVVATGIYENAKLDIGAPNSLAPFTVFVPSNNALATLASFDTHTKKKTITYHVVPGKKIMNPAEEMKDGVPTVGGLLLKAAGNTVFLDESKTIATITSATPIEARNGVIYLIDTTLLPATA